MNCHIIPRTTLKEFSEDKINIEYIDNTFEIKRDKISIASTIENFYSEEKENELAREYETKYGVLKKKIKEACLEKKVYIRLSKEEYIFLIKYDTIQWRRTKFNIDKVSNELLEGGKNFIRNSDEEMLINKNKVESIKELEENFKDFDYNKIVRIYDEDYMPGGFIHKQLNFYTPVFIVNKSDINFPLHDKINTIFNNKLESLGGFPDEAIAPITNRIFFNQRFRRKGVKWSENHVKVPIEIINQEKEVSDLIKKYVLGSSNRVYVDSTNVDIVKDIYKFKKEYIKRTGNSSK